MCDNCFKYNPPTDPIHQHGRQLIKTFEEKWQHLPVDEEEHDEKSVIHIVPEGDDDEKLEKIIAEV